MSDAVTMAYQIVNMDREIHRLRTENESLRWYKESYTKLLTESIAYSEWMAGSAVALALGLSPKNKLLVSKKED